MLQCLTSSSPSSRRKSPASSCPTRQGSLEIFWFNLKDRTSSTSRYSTSRRATRTRCGRRTRMGDRSCSRIAIAGRERFSSSTAGTLLPDRLNPGVDHVEGLKSGLRPQTAHTEASDPRIHARLCRESYRSAGGWSTGSGLVRSSAQLQILRVA